MNYHSFRLHTTKDLSEVYDSLLTILCDTDEVIVCHEFDEAARPHIQGMLLSHLTQQTFRARFVKLFTPTGNKEYSIKDVYKKDGSPEKAIRYIMKDGNYKYRLSFPTVLKGLISYGLQNPWIKEDVNFEKQVKKIDDLFTEGSLCVRKYVYDLLTIYANFDKTPRYNTIRDKVLRISNKVNHIAIFENYRLPNDVRAILTRKILYPIIIEQ